MPQSLIPKNEFVGLSGVAHLAMGGEAPMLCTHQQALQRFMEHKSCGEPARNLQAAEMQEARERSAALFKVPPDDLTFLSSATEGINVLRFGLQWQPGDNVVVADVEFPSDILPWTGLQKDGVEIRVVRHKNWVIEEDDVLALIDDRSRVVALSQVSMFTGQRMDVARLSGEIRSSGAIFLMDATHAAGVVPVDASLADIVVSSCYKWLLATHGTALFYWNRQRLAELDPPFLGWASPSSSGGWQSPLDFELPAHADRFLSANPSYISIYVLNNALKRLQSLDENAIEQHTLALGRDIRQALDEFGLEWMTPLEDERRAGNTCFMVNNVEQLRSQLGELGVLVWGAYGDFGRVRISAHVHNDDEDAARLIEAMKQLKHLC